MANRQPLPRQTPLAPSLLTQAVAHHQAGRIDEAASLYRKIVEQTPGHFDATHLLGVIALQRDDLAAAEKLIVQALASKPKDSAALNNLGTVLLRAQRLDEAREQFERSVKAQPGDLAAQSNLGNVLHRLGRFAEAIVPLRRAFAGNSKSAEIADLLGASLLESGDARAAATVFETAVKFNPGKASSWTHLAIACQRGGNPRRALEAADEAVRLAPQSARAFSQRGQALAALGDAGSAREAFENSTRLAPDDASMHHNHGAFLRDQGDFEKAVERLRNAVRLDPALGAANRALVDALIEAGRTDEAMKHGMSYAAFAADDSTALATLAAAQFGQDRIEEAVATYARATAAANAGAQVFIDHGRALMVAGDAAAATKQFTRAVDLDPQDAHARFALAMSHLRTFYDSDAEMATSRRAFARAVSDLDGWCTPARAGAAAQAAGSAQPFYLAYHPVDVRPLLAPYGKLVARLMAGTPVPKPAGAAPLAPLRARKLRVGIVSAQVRDHSVWNAITRGWVQHLDRARFDLSVFHLERTSDAETARTRRSVDLFIDAPTNLAAWAQAIADAELDVIIYPEIGMHPLTTRLAAMRLAPVQAAAWGHPQTSGLPTLDLYFSAQAFEPPQAAAHYTERLVALPGIGVCTQALKPTPVAPDLASLGLPAAEPLLLCPGTPFKYTPQSDAAWVAIARGLQARGAGRLVFFGSRRATISRQLEERLRRAFAAAGVDHDRTVAWIPTLPRDQFFGLIKRATLMLDTIGFSGFNTALQALECDLPVVAFEGEFMRGRLASGPLRLLGLDELVAGSIDEFTSIALRLVDDDAMRLRIKTDIAERRTRLFDDLESVRAFERALMDAAGKP